MALSSGASKADLVYSAQAVLQGCCLFMTVLWTSAGFAGVVLVFGEAMSPTVVKVDLLANVLGVGLFDGCREGRCKLFRCVGAWCDLCGVVGAVKASGLGCETFEAGLLVVSKVGLKNGPSLFSERFVFPCSNIVIVDFSFAQCR